MASPIDFDAVEDALARANDAPAGPAHAGVGAEHKRALSTARGQVRKGNLIAQALTAVDEERNLEGARLALEAVKAFPDAMPAYLAAAVALDRLGYLFEALAFYEQANTRTPNNPAICALIGMTAERCEAPEIAARCYRLASQLEPDNPAHIANLGGVLRDLGRFAEAVEILRNQIYVTPTDADLWNTLGTVLQEQGDPEQAVTFLSEAVRLRPGFARALHNLGGALTDLARFGEAGDALDKAITLAASPADRAEMLHARAWARFGAGRMAEGWDDYEARFDPLTRDPFLFQAPRPRWEGEALAGKRLLVLGEQGLGDEVLLMNAAPDVLEEIGRAGKLTIGCERRLVDLFTRSFPSANVIAHYTGMARGRKYRMAMPESVWDEVDLWAPMGALAKRYRRDASEFPARAGYLTADPARVAALKAQLSSDSGLKIGIVWKSLVMTPKRQRFFAPFSAWGALLNAPGASIYSLQYGETEEEERYARETWGVEFKKIEGLDLKDDLDGVAAAGQALDLVIGPMNATTNLAAACGGLVWFLHRFGTFTMHGTDGSPYYPHTRTFRAPSGEWRRVFEVMAQELQGEGLARASAA